VVTTSDGPVPPVTAKAAVNHRPAAVGPAYTLGVLVSRAALHAGHRPGRAELAAGDAASRLR